MAGQVYTVRFEPVGVEMGVEEGETVLDAAFRQGISLMHGCKEGQCSACKSLLVEGDVELGRHSTFALPDYERETNHILLCRSQAYSDLVIELLNYDEEVLRRSIAVRDYAGRVVGVEALTHDIRMLEVELDAPIKFWAGQYMDITIPGSGITRAFSMANRPDGGQRLQFIIKKYPEGAFSSRLDAGSGLRPGDALGLKGPYGTCFRREGRNGPLLLIGGGSGMSPLWSILQDHVESGETRPVRFFYGARTSRDLFYAERFAHVASRLPDFRFVPSLSHSAPEESWEGETGFIHEVLASTLRAEGLEGGADAYACGPPPMIDAVLPVLRMAGVEPERTYFDKFTTAVAASAVPAAA